MDAVGEWALVAAAELVVAALLGTGASSTAVPALYARTGEFCGVPARLLYAVALVESDRPGDGGIREPWPWTLNVAGEGRYFESRQAAYEALIEAIKRGDVVDIGEMQLNWGYKYAYLVSPWLATDRVFNITTACRILRNHYRGRASGNWFLAAGLYHREATTPTATAARGAYIARVQRAWRSLQ